VYRLLWWVSLVERFRQYTQIFGTRLGTMLTPTDPPIHHSRPSISPNQTDPSSILVPSPLHHSFRPPRDSDASTKPGAQIIAALRIYRKDLQPCSPNTGVDWTVLRPQLESFAFKARSVAIAITAFIRRTITAGLVATSTTVPINGDGRGERRKKCPNGNRGLRVDRQRGARLRGECVERGSGERRAGRYMAVRVMHIAVHSERLRRRPSRCVSPSPARERRSLSSSRPGGPTC
jgi:hypothetical protein